MEPFFLRCETCHARLRVRDEQFLGQVQSCPKCGSMVQIIAPAGWLATGESATPDVVEVAAVESPTMLAKIVCHAREHALLWALGTSAMLVAGGTLGVLALRGEEPVTAQSSNVPVAKVVVEEPTQRSEEGKREAPIADEEPDAGAVEPTVVREPVATPTAFLPLVLPVAQVERAKPPVAASSQVETKPVAQPAATRTLTLDAIELDPRANAAGAAVREPLASYPPVVVSEQNDARAEPQAGEPPARVTNVGDQLSVPIESIELPAMSIGEFVNLISEMSAVPITLDPKVLGDVGLSTRTKVVVRGGDVTLGNLLARVLKEHQLTYVEREGVLVVVKAKR